MVSKFLRSVINLICLVCRFIIDKPEGDFKRHRPVHTQRSVAGKQLISLMNSRNSIGKLLVLSTPISIQPTNYLY